MNTSQTSQHNKQKNNNKERKNTRQCQSTWERKHVRVETKHAVTSTERQGHNKVTGWRQKSLQQVCL